MATFQDLHTLIVNKIKTLTTITEVYAHEKADASSFPYATVVYIGNDNEVFDTANNLRGYKFRVRVYMKIGSQAPLSGDDAERSSEAALQEVINAFDTDFTLGGACNGGIKAAQGDGGYT